MNFYQILIQNNKNIKKSNENIKGSLNIKTNL